MRPTTVYISGPITDRPKDEYMAHFKATEKKLLKMGYWVLNPAEVNRHMPTWFKHDDYMEVCKPELLMCDMICMLDGWEKSLGAIQEKAWADHYHIPAIAEGDLCEA